jgi:thiamine biosynthesis lipoprotein
MYPIRQLLIFAAAAALACGCAEPAVPKAEFFVFGTLVEVELPGASADQANAIFSRLQQEMQRMHYELHAWEPGELVRVNNVLQSGGVARATPDILALLKRSQDMEQRSGGYFNPAIGKLVALWGFHTSEYPVAGPPPGQDEIDVIIAAQPSTLDILIDNDRFQTANPQVQLDFGGIAKGFAIDLACEMILGSGLESAIVNAGGDLRTIGLKHGRPWRIAVTDPGGSVAGAIEVSGGMAVFTSGNYVRYRQDAGERYAHILHPQTGRPVNQVSSATVIASDGTTADAAATAIVVAGLDDWARVAADMGIETVLVIDESGGLFATREMMDYFKPIAGREVTIVD